MTMEKTAEQAVVALVARCVELEAEIDRLRDDLAAALADDRGVLRPDYSRILPHERRENRAS